MTPSFPERAMEEFDSKFPVLKRVVKKIHRPGTMHERLVVNSIEELDTSAIKSFFLAKLAEAEQEERKRILTLAARALNAATTGQMYDLIVNWSRPQIN